MTVCQQQTEVVHQTEVVQILLYIVSAARMIKDQAVSVEVQI